MIINVCDFQFFFPSLLDDPLLFLNKRAVCMRAQDLIRGVVLCGRSCFLLRYPLCVCLSYYLVDLLLGNFAYLCDFHCARPVYYAGGLSCIFFSSSFACNVNTRAASIINEHDNDL